MKKTDDVILYNSRSQHYDLDEAFSTSQSNKGLVICFALATCPKAKMISFLCEAKHEEIGVPLQWQREHTYESFNSVYSNNLEKFLDVYDDDDFGSWRMKIDYQNVEISISGHRTETEIGLHYPKDKPVNLLPLLYEVETSTYQYNDYDKRIIGLLKSEYGMSEKRAVLTVQKLLTHKDIYNEFAAALSADEYADESTAINVEGFTAELLNSKYPLSLLGAYNYLIYLRESPQEALEALKKGLPRK